MAEKPHTSLRLSQRRGSEAGPLIRIGHNAPFPKWPRFLSATLNLFILLASIAVLGVVAHSLNKYSGTRGIQFTGLSISWPVDLDLRPIYFFLAVSALTIAPALLSIIISIRQAANSSLGTLEIVTTAAAFVLFVLWIAVVTLQRVSKNTPKRDLLMWACRRRQSPTNAVVSYREVCEEQVAIQCLGILIFVAEAGCIAASLTVWYLIRRRSKHIDQPWRMKT